jgi:hypothetical protein
LYSEVPFFAENRWLKQRMEVCGTKRPLSAFSMCEALLFQRTFLRSLDSETSRLIMVADQIAAKKSSAKLQKIHAGLLKVGGSFFSPRFA